VLRKTPLLQGGQSRRYKIVDSKKIPKTKELIEQMEEYKKRTGNATAGKIRCYI